MTVYFIQRNEDPAKLVKIGFSKNLSARLKNMSTAWPAGVTVLAACAGGAKLECHFHKVLADHRVAGEWFSPHPTVMAAIEEAKLIEGEEEAAKRLTPRMRGFILPEDEHSDDIVVVTRFYMNELVKREWRGFGDSTESARDRVMGRLSLARTLGHRVWHRYSEMTDVSGQMYSMLHRSYLEALEAESKLTDAHSSMLAMLRRADRDISAKRAGAAA